MNSEKTSVVHTSTEYEKFSFPRNCSEDHVAYLVRKFDAGVVYMEEFPGLVKFDNERNLFIIVDGTCRFMACKRTNRPFFFCIIE
jgi:hypothetical protein